MTNTKTTDLALSLLDWNRKNLVHNNALTETLIAEKFADNFTVKANGRTHPANHATYLKFLNGFRSTIASIDYRVHETITEANATVLAMTAEVVRVDNSKDVFEAMLHLKFNDAGMITLWNEIYIKTS